MAKSNNSLHIYERPPGVWFELIQSLAQSPAEVEAIRNTPIIHVCGMADRKIRNYKIQERERKQQERKAKKRGKKW